MDIKMFCRIIRNPKGFTVVIFLVSFTIFSQNYTYINYSENKISTHNQGEMDYFNDALQELENNHATQVHVVHLGDSHIQAGFLSEKLRTNFQSNNAFNNGGRGFIFPYKIGRTVGPSNFTTTYDGKWESCKIVQSNSNCVFGLSGITVTTEDETSTICIDLNKKSNPDKYNVKRVKIFHRNDSTSFEVNINPDVSPGYEKRKEEFFTEFTFNKPLDYLDLTFAKNSEKQNNFELYGISMETFDSGLIYSEAGVNGAEIEDYLRSELLVPHLKTLNPSLLIISLGTNDAYPKNFNEKNFKENYTALLRQLRKELPKTSFLLTTPGDAYRQRKYYNPNNEKAGKIIFEIAEEENAAVWDFYRIMGGKYSIDKWKSDRLAKSDKIHLTVNGYFIQGELLYDALLNSFHSQKSKTKN